MGNPGNPLGLATPAFNASFAFFLVFMGSSLFPSSSPVQHRHVYDLVSTHGANDATGLVCLIFLICSLRTNIVFFVIFLTLVCAFACLAGAYWNLALVYENPTNLAATARAGKLVKVSTIPHLSLHHPNAPSQSHSIREALINNSLIGGWRIHLCHLLGRLVDLPRHYACLARLPAQHPCRRSVAYHQRCQRKEEGKGYGLEYFLPSGLECVRAKPWDKKSGERSESKLL